MWSAVQDLAKTVSVATLILFVLLLVLVVIYDVCERVMYAGMNLPPQRLGLPFLGVALEFAKSQTKFAECRPSLSTIRFLGVRAILVRDPKAAEQIVRGEGSIIRPHSRYLPGVSAVIGVLSLAGSSGLYHKKLRSQLLPAFSSKAIKRTFQSVGTSLFSRHVGMWKKVGVFDGAVHTRALAADIGCSFTGLNADDPATSVDLIRFVDALADGSVSPPVIIPGVETGFSIAQKEKRLLRDNYILPAFEHRRKNPLDEDEAKYDMISCLLKCRDENGELLTQAALEENIVMNLYVAVDTTGIQLMHFMRYMCMHQDVQEKVRKEINEVLGDSPDDITAIHDKLGELKYLEQVLREVIRMSPVVASILFRKAAKTFTMNGYTVPEGMNLMLHTHSLGHHPDLFSEPNKFDPERFAPGGSGLKHNRILLDFGFGSNACPGERFAQTLRKMTAVLLLRGHRLEFANGKPPVVTDYSPVQKVVGAFPVKISPVST